MLWLIEPMAALAILLSAVAPPSREEYAHDTLQPDRRKLLPSAHAPGNELDKMRGIVPWPAPEVEAAAYVEQASLLAAEGVDGLFLEMLWNREHAERIVAAVTAAVDLPILAQATPEDSACLVTRTGAAKVTEKKDVHARGQLQDEVKGLR